jgi:hypothetical protein
MQGFQLEWKHPAAGCPAASSPVSEASLFPSKLLHAGVRAWESDLVCTVTSSMVSLPASPTLVIKVAVLVTIVSGTCYTRKANQKPRGGIYSETMVRMVSQPRTRET